MSTSLNQISPETLKTLENQAASLGLTPDEYLRRLLPESEKELALRPDVADEEFDNDMAVFAEGTDDLPKRNLTYSREDIYFDHN